jgi:hypothetical protein
LSQLALVIKINDDFWLQADDVTREHQSSEE